MKIKSGSSAGLAMAFALLAGAPAGHAARGDEISALKNATVIPADGDGAASMRADVTRCEWCEDDYHEYYNGAPTDGSAWKDTPRGVDRVFRGGSWSYPAWNCRSAYRIWRGPEYRLGVGFRVVLLSSSPRTL
jgi:hypothetical protein